MSEQYPGGFISKTEPTVNGSVARGMWTLSQAAGYAKQGLWPTIPGAPTIGTATAGVGSASVAFTAPSNTGSSAITSYTATSSPGGFTGTGASSPITVSGLTNGTAYTFTVTATNGAGTSPASAASNSVSPLEPNYIEDVYSTYIYRGNGSARTITTGVDLSANNGLIWIKGRSFGSNHQLYTTLLGGDKDIFTNETLALYSRPSPWLTFNSNGFSLSSNTIGNTVNPTDNDVVAWTFRDQPKFFDTVAYTGNGTSSNTISHNLQSVPGCVIIKATSATGDWWTFVENANSPGSSFILKLNTTGAAEGPAGGLNITSSSFNAADMSYQAAFNYTTLNASGVNYIAYLFANNAGGFGLTGADSVISCGRYTGNGATPGTSVNLGYEPQWIMVKNASASVTNWVMVDNMRGIRQPAVADSSIVQANTTSAEFGNNWLGITSTGFYANGANSNTNTNGNTYIYIAIRRGPMKIPTSGTSVFSPVTSSAAAGTAITTGFPIDLQIATERVGDSAHIFYDRLRGVSTTTTQSAQSLTSNTYGAENSPTTAVRYWDNTGFQIDSRHASSSTIYHNFRRAPSVFDEVCYTGNGSTLSLTHNLTVAPEFILIKSRSDSSYWIIGSNFGASTYALKDDWGYNASSASQVYSSTIGFNSRPTSTTVSLSNNTALNVSNSTYVMWLWATCPGVSKVGTYTVTGALQTINCGFTTGARFVLITRIGVVGDVNTYIYDSARGITSGNDPYFLLESSAAEVTGTNYVDTTSTGFQVTAAAPSGLNANGGTYIFLAIA